MGKGRKLFDGKRPEIVIGKLEEAWLLGCNDSEAAFRAEISVSSLFDFLKRNPKIAERKALLKENPIYEARDSLAKTIRGGDGKLALDFLKCKRKDEFSTAQDIRIGEISEVRQLTDEQLAKIAAGKATPGDFIK